LVRLACERHLEDLRTGHERGLRWDQARADNAIEFFSFLLLSEGAFAGKPFRLEPFEAFIVGSLFGWIGPDGHRRFRNAYIEIAKGNGKTPMAAGIGLYGLVADEEASAEVYTAGVTRDQANYILRDARKFVENSPALKARVEVGAHNLAFAATDSFMRGVSSEARSLDQKRVHMALIDEIHEHPDSLVVDKMRAGTKGRRQALIIEITNSGYDRHSVCWQHHDYSVKVLEGLENDAWFAYVCGLDEGDDWTDEKVWPKANPGLDTIITRKYLREQVAEAQGIPAKENLVKRLNFCIWTEQATRFIPLERWDACPPLTPEEELKGREAWGGLDLASTTDLAALWLWLPDEDDYDILVRLWCPEEGVAKRSKRDRVPYDRWVDQGFIKATEGDVTDYDVIRADLAELGETYRINEIGYDPWNATQLVTQLTSDGLLMVPIRQGFASLSAPTKEILKLILEKRVRLGGHPVLRWMAQNVAVRTDPAGNIKPDKERSSDRIDAIAAGVTGLARVIVRQSEGPSVYETRGMLWIDVE
jgi:phage terminase large subunit-like protein